MANSAIENLLVTGLTITNTGLTIRCVGIAVRFDVF